MNEKQAERIIKMLDKIMEKVTEVEADLNFVRNEVDEIKERLQR